MRRLIGMIGGLGLALFASQAPEFTQQYEQRLGGAVGELATIVAEFDAAAARNGLNRAEALARYKANPDAFIVERGTDMDATIARYENLNAHFATLETAGPLARVVNVAQHYDEKIAAGTAASFVPGVPVSVEGAGFAGAGFLGGYGLIALFARPFRRRAIRRTQ